MMRSPAAGASLFLSLPAEGGPEQDPPDGLGQIAGPSCRTIPLFSSRPPGSRQIEKSESLGDNDIRLSPIPAGGVYGLSLPLRQGKALCPEAGWYGARVAPLPCRICPLALFLLIHWCSLSVANAVGSTANSRGRPKLSPELL